MYIYCLFVILLNDLPLIWPLPMKSVCIIGAGAGGLIASQVLHQDGFHVTVFEKNDYIGGVWKHFPKKGDSSSWIDERQNDPSSESKSTSSSSSLSQRSQKVNPMYQSLVTNLPKQIMAFNEDNLFPDELPSFVGHADVNDYLLEFARKHDLMKHIRLGTEVIDCREVNSGERESSNQQSQWKVSFRSARSQGPASESIFDFLLVCSGHFDVPYLPPVPNLDRFQGSITHAREYDQPTEFAGSRVLVVGSRSSGTDIARELANISCEVHVAERSRGNSSNSTVSLAATDLTADKIVHGSVRHHSSIRRIAPHSKTVEFEDDSFAEVDTIIFCTGYYYHFPFLKSLTQERRSSNSAASASASVSASQSVRPPSVLSWTGSTLAKGGSRMVPELHQQLFYIPNPSLAFIGLPYSIFPFFFFYIQLLFVSRVFSSQVQLPPPSDMYESLAAFEQSICDRDLYLQSKVQEPPSQMVEKRTAVSEKTDATVNEKLNRNYHYLGGDLQIQYLRSLVLLCGDTLPETRRYRLLQYIEFLRQIFDDVLSNRPAFVGAPDVYRSRNYFVELSSLSWKVEDV